MNNNYNNNKNDNDEANNEDDNIIILSHKIIVSIRIIPNSTLGNLLHFLGKLLSNSYFFRKKENAKWKKSIRHKRHRQVYQWVREAAFRR